MLLIKCGCMRTLGRTKMLVNLTSYFSEVGGILPFHFLNGKWASGHIAEFCFHFYDGYKRMSLQGQSPAIYLVRNDTTALICCFQFCNSVMSIMISKHSCTTSRCCCFNTNGWKKPQEWQCDFHCSLQSARHRKSQQHYRMRFIVC